VGDPGPPLFPWIASLTVISFFVERRVGLGRQRKIKNEEILLECLRPARVSAPSGPITMLCPSKTSSSCPPTRLVYANNHPIVHGLSAHDLFSQPHLAAWYGDALMCR